MTIRTALAQPSVRHGLIAGIAVFLLLIGTGTSYAVWSATATATATAKAATVSLTQATTTSLVHSYKPSSAERSVTGAFTVTNTGSRTSNYSVAVSTSSAAAAPANAVTITMWVSTPALPCVTATTAPTGNPGASPRTFSGTGLAAGANVVVCVRTDMAPSDINANKTKTLTVSVTSTLTAVRSDGVASTWSATSPAAPFTQTVVGETPSFISSCDNANYDEVLIKWTNSNKSGDGLKVYFNGQLVPAATVGWGPELRLAPARITGYTEGTTITVDVRDAAGLLVVSSTIKVQQNANQTYLVPRCAA